MITITNIMNVLRESKPTRLPKSVNIMICAACTVLFIDVVFVVYTIFIFYYHYFSHTWAIITVVFSLSLSLFIGRYLWLKRTWARTAIVILVGLAIPFGSLIALQYRVLRFSVFLLILIVLAANMAVLMFFMQKKMEILFCKSEPQDNPKKQIEIKQLPCASRESRFCAALIDKVLPLSMAVLPSLIYFMPYDRNLLFTVMPIIGLVYSIILLISIPLGIISLILIYFRSQTVGKWMFNIQVINNHTRERVDFWRYIFLRSIVGETCFGVTILVPYFLDFGAPLPVLVLLIYFIFDSLLILKKDKRTLHDLIGDTSVISLPEH